MDAILGWRTTSSYRCLGYGLVCGEFRAVGVNTGQTATEMENPLSAPIAAGVKGRQVPAIIEQNAARFKHGASAFEKRVDESEFLIDNHMTVTEISAGCAVDRGCGIGVLDAGFAVLHATPDRSCR